MPKQLLKGALMAPSGVSEGGASAPDAPPSKY